MTRSIGARVQISIIFREHVDVVENDTFVQLPSHCLHEADVLQHPSIQFSTILCGKTIRFEILSKIIVFLVRVCSTRKMV